MWLQSRIFPDGRRLALDRAQTHDDRAAPRSGFRVNATIRAQDEPKGDPEQADDAQTTPELDMHAVFQMIENGNTACKASAPPPLQSSNTTNSSYGRVF